MTWQVGQIFHGFRLIEEKNINEINSTSRLFLHEKSGARLLSLANDDDNKVFSSTFRTPPYDDTGLPHILEHCVLCGSRKFKTKEPFVDLLKGSLNTFLNAMTFPDKTMYPVASCNEKDLLNLMDVYMDGLFYPGIYDHPEFFMQEGWHYALENKDEELSLNGVVYNEMKGAFSNPDALLMRYNMRSLFPETPYNFESGGDPEVIPNLTYEQFLDFHRKYYHPSNSFIYLYGNGNLVEQLKFINCEYLCHFDKKDIDSSIPYQAPFSSIKEEVVEYSSEDLEKSTYIALNFAAGDALDAEACLGLSILTRILIDSEAAPLKRAVLQSQVAEVVDGYFDDVLKQPVFSIFIKNTEENQKENFKSIVKTTLERLVNEGLDRELVAASFNKKEFELREADFHGYPAGLVYNINLMNSWLHDGDPLLHIEYEKVLENIKSKAENRYFEDLIERFLLKNTHRSLVVLKPVQGLSERKGDELMKSLKEYKRTLSEAEIENIIAKAKLLRLRQQAPDTPEAIATIPLLSPDDISPSAKRVPIKEENESGVKVLFNPVYTNKIAYVNLMFNTSKLPESKVSYLGLLKYLLGKVSTNNYSYEKLSNSIDIHTGGIRADYLISSNKASGDIYYPNLIIKGKSVIENLHTLIVFMKEIINDTLFSEKERILELIRKLRSNLEIEIFDSGNIFAATRALSYLSLKAKYSDMVNGICFYEFICNIEENFEANFSMIKKDLEETARIIFDFNNLIINLVCEEDHYNYFRSEIDILISALTKTKLDITNEPLKLEKLNEGLIFTSEVQYVAKCAKLLDDGDSYNGSLQVAQTIVNYDYLWNKVRVQGGAYGCRMNITRDGYLTFWSYRDPRLKETIEVYDSTPSYLSSFNGDDMEMMRYIVGTFSKIDIPLTPSMKGNFTMEKHLSGITYEELDNERKEILNTKAETIRALGEKFESALSLNNLCVLGNENKIKGSENLFNMISTLI